MTEIKEQDKIVCPGCNTTLVLVLVTTVKDHKKSVRTKYKVVDCFNCGSDSFMSKIYQGAVSVAPPTKNLSIELVDTDVDDEEVITCTIKTTKLS